MSETRIVFMLRHEVEEGAWQEGVAAKIHSHDAIVKIFDKVVKLEVGYAEGQVKLCTEIDLPHLLHLPVT